MTDQQSMPKTAFKIILFAVVSGSVIFLAACNESKKHQKMETTPPKISNFPTGEENTGYAQYFTGRSWLAQLTTNKDLNVPMSNVTFEPGCRNNWHSHSGGQILVAVGREALFQERGKAARLLKAGDVVEIAPDTEHWHGATAGSWFAHLAITCNPQTNENKWLEKVTDETYKEANNQK